MRAEVRSIAFAALGSTCCILAIGVGEERLERARQAVLTAHHRWSRFEPESDVSALNRNGGRWVAVPHDLEELLRFAIDAWQLSAGLVHAGVERRLVAAGYSRPLSERAPSPPGALLPSPLPPLPALLEVARGRARVQPGFGIDLGGLAKGWLADQLAERLTGNCVVNLGGDLRALGEGPEGRGWPVAVGDGTLLLTDSGAATSGTRRRRWGAQLHHLIDPRTGLPSRSDLELTSVVTQTAARAEVTAKATLLAGRAGAAPHLAGASAWWAQ
jgi:thiamine biosynthesis lipoprotein